MDPNKYRDLGEDLKRIVSDAVGSQNYDDLSENISKMVSGALSAAGTEIRKTGESLKNSFFTNTAANAFPYPVNKKALPSGYGMVSLILGSAGTAGFAVLAFLSLLADYFLPSTALTVIFAALAAVCLVFAVKGYRAYRLKKHFKRYIVLMSGEKQYLIDDIAALYPLDRKVVAKELSRLITLGAFPQGHIDDEKKYFIGDNETYQYYLRTKETERRIMSNPQEARKLEQTRASIEKGRQYIESIRHANDIIIDKEMSDKLDTTELILKNIFDRLEKRPDLVPDARKLIEYYLPITEKLLSAYIELDRQNIGSENIDRSKLEIEKSMDSVNTAFYNLYNSLFTDDKVDIISDISVLRSMFAQEGLNNSDFKKGKDDPNGN